MDRTDPTRPSPRSRLVRMLSPLRDFLATESAGAALIAAAAIVAVAWANSPWSGSYERLWSSHIAITIAGHTLDLSLRHWLNDGLMTVFFLVVGLEIKRELTDGHLSNPRAAALPMVAALGGMIAPAVIYLSIAGGSAPRGWAIPMATDIALAVGVLAVAGSSLPTSLRAFLLGLAIVDDIGAIIIIAAVYSSGLSWGWLLGAAGALAGVIAARNMRVQALGVYVALGTVIWLAMHEAGVHPTLTGVALGLLAPSTPMVNREYVDSDDLADSASVGPTPIGGDRSGAVSVVEWLQHVLHPWTSFLIVPVFALANAGIEVSADGLRDALTSPIAWGIFVGLIVGKPLGILLSVAASTSAGLTTAPAAPRRQVLGIGTAAGIGFTVAIFITELALTDPAEQADAKLAILVASVVAALGSSLLLRMPRRSGTAAVTHG